MFVAWDAKPAALLAANPMGKLPTVVHHHGGHDHVVSEAAAVCHYIAEMSAPTLLPTEHEKADYFRMLFFAAGPLEQAVTNKAFGWNPDAKQELSVGFGSFERTIGTLEGWFSGRDYVCGSRFTMADVYVGSAVDWGLQFGSIPERGSLTAYAERIRQREAYQAGKAIDTALIAETQGAQGG